MTYTSHHGRNFADNIFGKQLAPEIDQNIERGFMGWYHAGKAYRLPYLLDHIAMGNGIRDHPVFRVPMAITRAYKLVRRHQPASRVVIETSWKILQTRCISDGQQLHSFPCTQATIASQDNASILLYQLSFISWTIVYDCLSCL